MKKKKMFSSKELSGLPTGFQNLIREDLEKKIDSSGIINIPKTIPIKSLNVKNFWPSRFYKPISKII